MTKSLSMRGDYQELSYEDTTWGIKLDYPFFLTPKKLSEEEYICDLVNAGLCSAQTNPTWDSVMAEVQMWGPIQRQIMHNYNKTEQEAFKIVSSISKAGWKILLLKRLADAGGYSSPLFSTAPLRAENQRELISQLEDVRSTFFYTTPEQIDKEVGRLDATRRGLIHSIYNVAGVIMSPSEVLLLTSASATLATKISGLMQVRKRMMEQAKDKQSGPLDTSF